MPDVLTKRGFKELYNDLEIVLLDFLKNQELTENNFDSLISQMLVTVRARMLILGDTAISGSQVYQLMALPYRAMLKATELKRKR